MAKPKTEPQPAAPAGAATETAEGAVPAPAGAPADTGAGEGDPAPVSGAGGGGGGPVGRRDQFGLSPAAFDAIVNASVMEIAARPPHGLLARIADLVAAQMAEAPITEQVVQAVSGQIAAGDADGLVDALLARLTQRELLVTEVVMAELVADARRGVAAEALGASTARMPSVAAADDPPPPSLCERHGVALADVFSWNPLTGTVVTIDGQKHRLA